MSASVSWLHFGTLLVEAVSDFMLREATKPTWRARALGASARYFFPLAPQLTAGMALAALYPLVEELMQKPNWRRSVKYKQIHWQNLKDKSEIERQEKVRQFELVQEVIEACIRDGDLVEHGKALSWPDVPAPLPTTNESSPTASRRGAGDEDGQEERTSSPEGSNDDGDSLWGSAADSDSDNSDEEMHDQPAPSRRSATPVKRRGAEHTAKQAKRRRVVESDEPAAPTQQREDVDQLKAQQQLQDERFHQLEERLASMQTDIKRKDEQIEQLTANAEAARQTIEGLKADRTRIAELVQGQTELLERMSSGQVDSTGGSSTSLVHQKDVALLRLSDTIARIDNSVKGQKSRFEKQDGIVKNNSAHLTKLDHELRRTSDLAVLHNDNITELSRQLVALRADDVHRAEKINKLEETVRNMRDEVMKVRSWRRAAESTTANNDVSLSGLNEELERRLNEIEDQVAALKRRPTPPPQPQMQAIAPAPAPGPARLLVNDELRPQFDRIRQWRLEPFNPRP